MLFVFVGQRKAHGGEVCDPRRKSRGLQHVHGSREQFSAMYPLTTQSSRGLHKTPVALQTEDAILRSWQWGKSNSDGL